MREAGRSLAKMGNEEIVTWQNQTHKRGSLLATWDHMTELEVLCLVLDDKHEMINPFGRKNKIRKITVMIEGRIAKLSPYDIFPIGEARETIPF